MRKMIAFFQILYCFFFRKDEYCASDRVQSINADDKFFCFGFVLQ